MNRDEQEGFDKRIEQAHKNGQKWGELLERLRFLTQSAKDQESRLQRVEQKLVAVNLKAGLVGLLGGCIPILGGLIYVVIKLIIP